MWGYTVSVTFIVGLGSLWGHPGNGPASFLVLLGLGLDWTCLVNCQLAQFSCFFPKCRMMLKFRLDSGLGFWTLTELDQTWDLGLGLDNFLQIGQADEVLEYFEGKSHGIFVEAGAFNGEYLSNTLYLEVR